MGTIETRWLKDGLRNWLLSKKSGLYPQASYMIQGMLNILEQVAGVLAPFRSGELRYSHIVEMGGLEGVMYPTAFHAIFVILGTKPHPIEPVNKLALWWPGAWHPVKHVDHPGTSPQDYINEVVPNSEPGLEQEENKFLDWLST